jgi:hypothetical protein
MISPSDIIAVASLVASTGLTLYLAASTRRREKRESYESRLNRAEDRTIALEAQVSIIVGGIQRLDSRQERIEDLLFGAFGGPHGRDRKLPEPIHFDPEETK